MWKLLGDSLELKEKINPKPNQTATTTAKSQNQHQNKKKTSTKTPDAAAQVVLGFNPYKLPSVSQVG